MTKTITCTAPQISTPFNPYLLLDFLGRLDRRLRKEIIPKAHKKIRVQDTGKQRKFNSLIKNFMEIYERKKAEEVIYKAKVKEAQQKIPNLSPAGSTIRFRRMDTGE